MLNIHFARRRNDISIEGILIFELWHIIIPKSFMTSNNSSPVHTDVEFYVCLTACITLDLRSHQ